MSSVWIVTLLFQLLVTTALMCYDCNSEFDPRCGDPFEPYSIGEVNCSKQEPLEHLKDKYKPTLCRKTVQKSKLESDSLALAYSPWLSLKFTGRPGSCEAADTSQMNTPTPSAWGAREPTMWPPSTAPAPRICATEPTHLLPSGWCCPSSSSPDLHSCWTRGTQYDSRARKLSSI